MAIGATKPIEEASDLMLRFAERTGLGSDQPPSRYLWTDAFAVCNFLGLARKTGEDRYVALALRLVDQVHRVLGQYREDDSRSGWISGLVDGELHPTRGGLRIGKPFPERSISERFDEQSEWQRDGQYFHYLTKWMHALDQVHRFTGQGRYHTWARELAKAAHDAFVYRQGERLRMVWKMSTDLSRPLVGSMGHHDPLDGFVTYSQLEATAGDANAPPGPSLKEGIRDFASMLTGGDWATTDPLGLGGLLTDASRISQLEARGAWDEPGLGTELLRAAARGLEIYTRARPMEQPASRRLAFRELGLAIGLSGAERIEPRVQDLAPHFALGRRITAFWADFDNRQTRVWAEHRDINEVMLATSLEPGGFLAISPAFDE